MVWAAGGGELDQRVGTHPETLLNRRCQILKWLGSPLSHELDVTMPVCVHMFRSRRVERWGSGLAFERPSATGTVCVSTECTLP